MTQSDAKFPQEKKSKDHNAGGGVLQAMLAK